MSTRIISFILSFSVRKSQGEKNVSSDKINGTCNKEVSAGKECVTLRQRIDRLSEKDEKHHYPTSSNMKSKRATLPL
jgi:hypothetical protein